jgi:hypothetical protein
MTVKRRIRRARRIAAPDPHVAQSQQAIQILLARDQAGGFVDNPPGRPERPLWHPNDGRDVSVRGRHEWTPGQLDTLEMMYNRGDPVTSIADYFQATYYAVRTQAQELGIKHLTKSRTLSQRFGRKIALDPASGCLVWTGSCNKGGLAVMRAGQRVRPATHIALALAGIEVPLESVVMHRCGNLRCVNIDHLCVGRDECRYGHPLIGGNLVVYANGRWRCRACQNETARRSRGKRKKAAAT